MGTLGIRGLWEWSPWSPEAHGGRWMHRALGLPTQVRCMKGLGSPFSAALRPGPWGFIICFVPSVLGPEPRVQAGLSLEGGGRGGGVTGCL